MEFVTIGTVHLIQLACLLSFLCLTKADHPVYVSCSNEKNYTVGSQYQANVNLTLNALATNASLKGFYNTTSGDYPDKVYGLIQCRADVSTKDCLGWADKLTSETYKRCSQQKEVFIAYHLGLVHYSNNNFLSKPFSHPQERYNWGGIASDRDKFNQKLGGLMANLSMIASYLPSKFSRGMTDVTDFINVYGMVECTRDLNQLACSQCLQGMRNSIPTDGHQGGLFLSVTCYVRYDIYPFEHSPSVGTPPRPPTLPDKTDSSYAGKTAWMIVIISLAASVVGALSVIFVYLRFMNRTREERNDISKESQLKLSHQLKSLEFFLIHLNVIKAATDNFSAANKLGQGGFGPVYKGMLHDGTKVAVKRLSTTSGQGLKEFKNEIILISKLQHRNLVRLLGCCIENGENLLVYEYLPNSSLDVSLFDPIKRAQLDWTRRFNIILGIARGLLYLHEDSQLRVIHRDLKASNVLLDNEMNPKISDFGIARMFEGNQTRANTNRVVGTYGYMAPEYAMGGLISTKSDVYSFGVLVLEIISGKRTSSINDSECPQCLTGYAWRLWSEGESLGLMDPILIKSHVCNEVLKCIHVGLLCVQDDPVDRPSMSGVVVMLRGDSIILEQPTQPAFSRKSVGAASGQSPQHAKARSKNNLTI